jgi:hypothetical protein
VGLHQAVVARPVDRATADRVILAHVGAKVLRRPADNREQKTPDRSCATKPDTFTCYLMCLSARFSRPQELAVTGVLNLCVGRRTSAAAKAEQGLKGGSRFTTTVRAEDEFIEIDLELAAAHAVMGADQPALKASDHPIGKRNDRLGSLAQLERGRLRSWHMGIAARHEHCKAREAIGGDGGICGDVSGSKILGRLPHEHM